MNQAKTIKSSPEGESICAKGHTILKSSCPSCSLLKKEWYGYLKYTGFEDIEKGLMLVDHKNVLDLTLKKDWQTKLQFEAKANYYEWARRKLTDGNFVATFSYKDQVIWENHCEGASRRDIANVVEFENSYISRKIDKIESFLRTHSVSSGAVQLDIFYWADSTQSE